MPRYVPEDSLQTPRFTGPATFARLPYVRTTRGRRRRLRRRAVRHRGDVPGRRPVRAERGPPGERHAPAVQREPRREAVRRPVVRRLRRHRDRARASPSGATRRSRRPSRRSSRPASSRSSSAATTPARCRTSGRRGRADPVAVIDFDSHTDAWDSYFGEKYNHGTWMRRAIEEGLVDVGQSIEVGLRGSLYDRGDWTGLRTELGPRVPDDRGRLPAGPGGRRRGDPRAGRRPAGVHQLRHRRRRPGLRARDGHARGRRALGAGHAGDPPRADRHRLRRVRRRRGHPGLRPGRPDGDAGGEPRLRDAVARRAADGSRADERRDAGGSPMPPGFRWPDGIRAAACFTFDVDAESPILFEHPEAADWLDVMTHQAYGRAGRDRRGCSGSSTGTRVRATFFIPGFTAERCAGDLPRDPRRRPRDRPSRLPPRGRPRRRRATSRSAASSAASRPSTRSSASARPATAARTGS